MNRIRKGDTAEKVQAEQGAANEGTQHEIHIVAASNHCRRMSGVVAAVDYLFAEVDGK